MLISFEFWKMCVREITMDGISLKAKLALIFVVGASLDIGSVKNDY